VLNEDLAIACGNPGAIRVTRIQRAGKSAMSAGELLRGYADYGGHTAPLMTRFRLHRRV
jgi:methionyl-tRNA formyltransferase